MAVTSWGTPVEQERRRRIRVAVAAYAYECRDDSIMDDHAYDKLAQSIDRSVSTGNALLDAFFRDEFSAMTGMWIRDHPQIDRIEKIYKEHYQ